MTTIQIKGKRIIFGRLSGGCSSIQLPGIKNNIPKNRKIVIPPSTNDIITIEQHPKLMVKHLGDSGRTQRTLYSFNYDRKKDGIDLSYTKSGVFMMDVSFTVRIRLFSNMNCLHLIRTLPLSAYQDGVCQNDQYFNDHISTWERKGPNGGKRKSLAANEILERSQRDDDLSDVYISDKDDEEDENEDDIYENIKVQKEIINNIRLQPVPISKKLRLLHLAKTYVEKHEGKLSRSHGYHEKGLQIWKNIQREVSNIIALLTPWEMRVKRIESHFGSVVASYFVFLRWLIWINVWLTLLPLCFVIIPEVCAEVKLIVGAPYNSLSRKAIPVKDLKRATDIKTIWDAEGIVEYSIIFYGYYGNTKTIGMGYRLPLAYLLTSFSAFVLSFIVVLRKMASNFRQSRLSNNDEHFTFSWKMFNSWDYMIGNTETANNKVASIATNFREAILEEKVKQESKNKYILFILRVLANICVLVLLGLSAYIIQLCVERTREMDIQKRRQNVAFDFWRENELTVVMTLISTIFPSLFDLVSLMEKYHPRTNLRWQLARIFVLNLLNLYTLFIALFWKQQDLKKEIDKQQTFVPSNCSETYQIPSQLQEFNFTTATPMLNVFVDRYNCTQSKSTNTSSNICWETMIGQEVLKLTIMDLVFVLGTIIIQDFIRGILVRYCNICCCWDLEKKFPEYGDFKTAENLLHLISNQGVIWLGTFFAPGLPVLNLLKLIILLYVRSWSVMVCNVPQEAIFRSSKSNNFYYGLVLIMLFLSMLPPLFAIVAVEPSPNCGPFSGQQKMFQILTETLEEELPPLASSVLEYAASPGVIIPVFMLLGMTIYYLISMSKALKESNLELRRELEYERKEGKRKIYAMADATRQLDKDDTDILNTKGNIKTATSSVMAAARIAKMLASSSNYPNPSTESSKATSKLKHIAQITSKNAKEQRAVGRKVLPKNDLLPQIVRTISANDIVKSDKDSNPTNSALDVRKSIELSRPLQDKDITDETPVAVVRSTQSIRQNALKFSNRERLQSEKMSSAIPRAESVDNSEGQITTKIKDESTQLSLGNNDEIYRMDESSFCHASTQTKYKEVNEVQSQSGDHFTNIQKYKVKLQHKRKGPRTSPNIQLRRRTTQTIKNKDRASNIQQRNNITQGIGPSANRSAFDIEQVIASKQNNKRITNVSERIKLEEHKGSTRKGNSIRKDTVRPIPLFIERYVSTENTEDGRRRHSSPILTKQHNADQLNTVTSSHGRRNTLQAIPEIRITPYIDN